MSRQPSDASSVPSSTAMNIKKFITETELTDHSRSSSTAHTSVNEHGKTTDASFNFINEGDKSQAQPPAEKADVPESEDNQKAQEPSDNSILEQPSPQRIIKEKSYQNKLKYLPNNSFKGDQSELSQNKSKLIPPHEIAMKASHRDLSYPTNSSTNSPMHSIPNTFKYKSHPNARTKSFIGVSTNQSNGQLSENNPERSHEKEDLTPPIKTSTLRATDAPPRLLPENSEDFNTTPDWMPIELAEKWVPPPSIENNTAKNYALNESDTSNFNSSVRITKKVDPAPVIDDLNLGLEFASGNTMIHNSNYNTNETPMWKKATKEYENSKQPNFHNIFVSLDKESQDENGSNNNIYDDMNQHNHANDGNSQQNTSQNQNHSISSTLSTPMATMSNHNSLPRNNLLNNHNGELENILEEETKQSYKFPRNPESPLKLFGDNYNTYTKEKLNGLLQRINNKSNLQTPVQNNSDNNEVDKLPPHSLLHKDNAILEEDSNLSQKFSNNSNQSLNKEKNVTTPPKRIKNFTKTGSYTEQQFLQNANDIFNNIQKRGFRVKIEEGNSIHKVSHSQSGPLRSISNTHTTATSTPKNFKINQEEDTYSSFTSTFGDSSGDSNFHQYNTDDGVEVVANDYTSIDHNFTTNDNRDVTMDYLPRIPSVAKDVSAQQFDSAQFRSNHMYHDSSYTFDEFSDDNDKPEGEAENNYDSLSTKKLSEGKNSRGELNQVANEKLAKYKEDTLSHQPSILQNSTNIMESDYQDMRAENVNLPPNEHNELNDRVVELEKLMRDLNSGKLIEELKLLSSENARLKEKLEKKSIKNEVPDDVDPATYKEWSEIDRSKYKEWSETSIDNVDFTQEDFDRMQNFIKWKRASQLKLSQSPRDMHGNSAGLKPAFIDENNTEPSIIRGRVKPGIELPIAYENMVLDVKNQRWVSTKNDKKEEFRNSLDSIEDLVTEDEDTEPPYQSSGKTSMQNNPSRSVQNSRKGNRLEVSFHLPHPDPDNIEKSIISEKSPLGDDVTRVSQLDDITFTQTQKKLVSVITEILSSGEKFDDISWNKVFQINLSGYQLDSIKDLNKFLPNLRTINVSRNEIKFLDGVPKQVLNLNLASNNIENITSFYQYKDLQYLDVSNNRLVNLTNFGKNIHLTQLNASNNSINSMNGINRLFNLTRLDLSSNQIGGEVDFSMFGLENLQEINLSENKIESVRGLEDVPNLRILNLNENNLVSIQCDGKHQHLKKLLLKFNSLKILNLDAFPYLRVLRLDGNFLNQISDIKRLKFLEEISCKSQHNEQVLEEIIRGSRDASVLDLSGNTTLSILEKARLNHEDETSIATSEVSRKIPRLNPFLNVNRLILSAMNLDRIPESMGQLFPNVRELNLNFNKLYHIKGLSQFKNLKKLYMVSNNISRTETIISGLMGARFTLQVLDLRLNPCNIELYPYVFNPQELEYANLQKSDANISPIQLETLDDIESFQIHYQSLSKSIDDWVERDTKFVNKLSNESHSKVSQRLNYETLLINFFKKLKRLDGGSISREKRETFKLTK